MGPHIRTGKRALAHAFVVNLFVCAAFAQTSAFNGRCQATGTPLQVRATGLAERFGDIELRCSGGTPGAVFTDNLTLFFPVSVTNRIDSTNLTRDAVVSVDAGGGLIPSAVPGRVSGNNISFSGISFTVPPTGNFTVRISGIRGAIGQLGLAARAPISALVSSSLAVDQSSLVVGYPRVGLLATVYSSGITCYGSPGPSDNLNLANLFNAGTAFASTRLTEGFASAFEVRSAGTDFGTRILVKYSGFPTSAHIYVPDFVAGNDALAPTAGGDLGVPRSVGQYVPGSRTLVLARVNGADALGAVGFGVGAPSGAGPVVLNGVSEVSLSGGSGYAVYEVVDANPNAQETVQFPTFIALPNVTVPAVAQESVSLAAVSSGFSASQTASIPRFLAGPADSDCDALGDCAAAYFPKLMVDSTPLVIAAVEKGGIMTTPPGYIPIRNGGGGLLNWNVTISYQTGSGWLFLDNSAGQGNASVRVWSDTKTLTAGTYHATININGGGAGNQALPLTLTVAALPPPPPVTPPVVTAPTVVVSKVVNAATFGATPLVAGSLGTLMGSHFLGKALAVTFDGTPATLLYSSDTQINLQVPATLGSKTSANLVVTVDGVSSAPFPVTLSPAWPAIFAHGVFNQDNLENTPAAAAKSGSILQIFATGIPKSAQVGVQYGARKDLVPLYAGEAPTVPGVQQVNVAIPEGGSSADLLICATVAGQQYCSSAYPIAVQ